ncbi:hypothetical protein CWI36_0849p0030, partial [Hamiltosporidium magnivora]
MDTIRKRKIIFVIFTVCTFIMIMGATFLMFSLHCANKMLKSFVDELETAKKNPHYKEIHQSLVESNTCCFYLDEKDGKKAYESGILIKASEAKKKLGNAIANKKYEDIKFSEFCDTKMFSMNFNVDITKLKKQADDVGSLAKIGLFFKRKNQFRSYLKLTSDVISAGISNKSKQKTCYIEVKDDKKILVSTLRVNNNNKIEEESRRNLEFEGYKPLSGYKAIEFVAFVFYISCSIISPPSPPPPGTGTGEQEPGIRSTSAPASTQAPTQAPTQASTSAPTPTQASTSGTASTPTPTPTQAPTSTSGTASTSAPTQAPTQASTSTSGTAS